MACRQAQAKERQERSRDTAAQPHTQHYIHIYTEGEARREETGGGRVERGERHRRMRRGGANSHRSTTEGDRESERNVKQKTKAQL